MKIKIEVELGVEPYKKGFFVTNRNAFNSLLGSSVASANLHMYKGVKREKRNNVLGWYVERGAIVNQINVMEERVKKTQDRLDFMKQVLKWKKA
jgi:hypothetical protein